MKNIYLIALVLCITLMGCQDDEYDAPNSFSDVGLYHSLGQNPLEINIYDYITFANLSQNFSHHEWTIGEGNFFIEGPFTYRDSSAIYEKRIINPGDTTSTEKTINVYFKKSGFQKIRMFNIFDEYVAFRGFQNGSAYTMEAEEVNGKWVIDTTLTVKVYDTIIPEIEVRQAEVLLDLESTDTIYVEAGDTLEFTDKTTIGEPTTRFWWVRTPPVQGIEPETVASGNQEVANLIFKKLGSFQAGITVSRSGQNIPADSDRLIITRPIKVVPSSQPFVITGTINEQEDETLKVPFNGEFSPFFNKEAFFEVKVNDVVFPISSVAINEDDATFLDIKLVDPIYRPDVITISLLDGSGIESTDTRTPVSFSDESVKMHNVNLMNPVTSSLEDGGFKGKDSWDAWWDNTGIVEVSDEEAASGDLSLKLTLEPGTNECRFGVIFNDPIALKAGTKYLWTYKRLIKPGSIIPAGCTTGNWFIPNWNQQGWTNFDGDVPGVWKEFVIEIEGSGINQILSRIRSNNADASIIAYFDDFFLVEKEERP